MEKDHITLLVNIDQKVDEVKDKLHNIEIVQTRMEGDLKYHIKRTDLLEDQIELMNKKSEPSQAIQTVLKYLLKFVPFITGVILAVVTLLKFLKE